MQGGEVHARRRRAGHVLAHINDKGAKKRGGSKKKNMRGRWLQSREIETENKVLLLSASLRLCIRDQNPLMVKEKLFKIPFYPYLLRTQFVKCIWLNRCSYTDNRTYPI